MYIHRHCWQRTKFSLTAHEAEVFFLMGRYEVQTTISYEWRSSSASPASEEKNTRLCGCAWEIISADRLLTNRNFFRLHLRTHFYSGFSMGVVGEAMVEAIEMPITWRT